jgi:hypothetical protein
MFLNDFVCVACSVNSALMLCYLKGLILILVSYFSMRDDCLDIIFRRMNMDWFWVILAVVVIFGVIGNNNQKKEANEKIDALMKRQQDAEEFIMKSGDQEAIKMLMLARANPSNYSNVLEGGMNKGNDTLRTALGVMTGVVAGNMISTAITANAISQALAEMETEFETALSDTDLELDGDVGDDDFDIFS